MTDPLPLLLGVLQNALKLAVTGVDGRVYLRRAMPRQVKDVSFIQISVGDEGIDNQDAAPYMVKRTRSISITPVVRGDTEDAYDGIIAIRAQIIAIMREIQMIPDVDEDAPSLIDEIVPTGESAIEIVANGEKFFTALTLSYDAVYMTEEGSTGESGAGVPQFNVLDLLKTAAANWRARRGEEQILFAEDNVNYEEE